MECTRRGSLSDGKIHMKDFHFKLKVPQYFVFQVSVDPYV